LLVICSKTNKDCPEIDVRAPPGGHLLAFVEKDLEQL
jgi:hypothetical protein